MNQLTEPDAERAGMHTTQISADLQRHLSLTLGRDRGDSHHYLLNALSLLVRDRLVRRWRTTQDSYHEQGVKQVHYLSLEFLLGRALVNAVLNLDIEQPVREAIAEYGCTLEDLAQNEMDAGLGNGGLGRLAACFLDSCAGLGLPVTGYGLRYEYGMFHQKIVDGFQVEQPDHWLRDGNPWEFEVPEATRRVKFGGRTEHYLDPAGRQCVRWVDSSDVLAVPFDMPIPGYRNEVVNTLRLWKASATDEFNLNEFNAGGYTESVAEKNKAEQISMVLYPNDASENGKELRLRQQYFLASASLQDVLACWTDREGNHFEHFAAKNGFQLNDTHPAAAVAELMRLLIDEQHLGWEEAWQITTACMYYTNHTLLPEALEKWSIELFGRLLPRLLEIIYEINARFLAEVAQRWPGDVNRRRAMSLIEEGDQPQVRMAHLAIVGSRSVNGVAALHTELLKEGLFRDFHAMWPERFNNKTNGVTPRRWVAHCNPALRELLNETIGDGWIRDFSQIEKLRDYADDPAFRARWAKVKRLNKQRIVDLVKAETGLPVDTDSLFDVQVKRIHEYKRQLLNLLHVVHLYDRIRRGDDTVQPRTVIIGGKAAPGYTVAKKIIKLANNIARVVNRDKLVSSYLKLVFLPNYRVSSMEILSSGAELSAQISTAGKEASGTGNMKFMMNGALTIGTLDGANVEIREAVGKENFFLFGLKTDEVARLRGHYNPDAYIASNPEFSRVIELLTSGHFNLFEAGIFDDLVNSIRAPDDQWMTAADFGSFVDAQSRVEALYANPEQWTRASVLNSAASGRFSSDRTIREYADEIWQTGN